MKEKGFNSWKIQSKKLENNLKFEPFRNLKFEAVFVIDLNSVANVFVL